MTLDTLQLLLTPDQFRRFMGVFAGTDVRFEKAAGGPSFVNLARVVGSEAAEKLREHFAGERIYVPRSVAEERERRNEEIRGRIASGESPLSIARSYRVVTTLSERSVRRIAAARSRVLDGATTETLERTLILDRAVASATAAAVEVTEKVRQATKVVRRVVAAVPDMETE